MTAKNEGQLCSAMSTKTTFYKAKATTSVELPAMYKELLNFVCLCIGVVGRRNPAI